MESPLEEGFTQYLLQITRVIYILFEILRTVTYYISTTTEEKDQEKGQKQLLVIFIWKGYSCLTQWD